MAKFEKGQIANPNGRPVGAISKDKAKFLAALEELFDKYSGEMIAWLSQVEDVEKRFEILSKYAEFLYPKLARNTIEGDPNNPVAVMHMSSITVDTKPMEFNIGKD